jgi:hypothetical protein
MAFSLYPTDKLPTAFHYPAQFATMASTGEHPQIGQWWFVDANSEAGELFYSIRKHDGRNLIPFAKGNDDIACFDGDDASGNPAVLILILDGSGRHYSFKNFADWLTAAEGSSGHTG